MDPKRHPKAYKMVPQVSQEAPKMAKAFPKAPQGVTRFPKVSPRAPQGLPKGSQGAPAERSWNLLWAKIGSKTSPQNGVPKGTPLKKAVFLDFKSKNDTFSTKNIKNTRVWHRSPLGKKSAKCNKHMRKSLIFNEKCNTHYVLARF